MKIIRKKQLCFLGHVMRLQQLESVCMELVDSLATVVGGEMSPAELLQMTFERACWRYMVTNIFEDTAQWYGK